MTCREFDRRWNELLDGCQGNRAGSALEEPDRSEQLLAAHAAKCARCREAAATFEVLRTAIRAWGPPPPAPAGLVNRVLAELETSTWPARRMHAWRWVAAASIAASLLAVVVVHRLVSSGGAIARRPAPIEQRDRQPIDEKSDRVDYRALNTALADATLATLDLARAASEPAARVGRQLIDAAARPETGGHDAPADAAGTSTTMAVTVPSLDLLAPDPAATAAVWQQVGDGLASGVRPLTTTARHAFGFLLGPPPVRPELRSVPRAQKGA
jgi:hypothetical protein